MRSFVITRPKVGTSHVVMVDDADFERVVAAGPWRVQRTPKARTEYAVRTLRGGGDKTESLHRFLMGAEKGVQVDHRNGNGLDCQRQNLRIATPQQNQQNKPKTVRNTSGFKGVTRHKSTGKWQAQLTVDGRFAYLGLFTSREAAFAAYCAAARDAHGEFARTA